MTQNSGGIISLLVNSRATKSAASVTGRGDKKKGSVPSEIA